MTKPQDKDDELRQAALEYHERPTPGKVAISATKQLTNERDLALAYSPGVAATCEQIVADPANAFRSTTSCAFPTSSAARWIVVSARSRPRWKWLLSMRCANWQWPSRPT